MQAKSGSWRPMSKKKDRGWFICPQWAELISRHYASDIEAGRALKADPKVLSKLRSGTPVAKSTALKMLRHTPVGMVSDRQRPTWSSTRERADRRQSAEPPIAEFNGRVPQRGRRSADLG